MNMRKIFLSLFLLVSYLFWTGDVQASEGRFSLTRDSIVCEGISIWQNRQYEVMGRCQGLVYPFSEQLTGYIFWAQEEDGGAVKRVDDINVGIIDGRLNKRFTRVFVTAEGESAPREPSGIEIVSGDIQPFSFRNEPPPANVTPTQITQTPTPTPMVSPTPKKTVNLTRLVQSAPAIIIIGVVVLVVIIFSLMWRRA